MKNKILVFILTMVVSISSFAAKDSVISGNLMTILSKSDFRLEKDSDSSMKMDFNKDKELIVDFGFTPASVWAQTVIDVKKPFTGLEAVKITYKTTSAVDIKLLQKSLGYDGNKFYQYYQYTLNATSDYATLTLPVAEFAFPKWVLDKLATGDASLKNLALPLNLNDVTGLHISPKPNQKAIQGTFFIKSIELVGVKL